MSIRSFVALLLAFLASLIFVSGVFAQGIDVAVIVNPNNPVFNVTASDLRKIFSGEKHTWPGGMTIKLVVRGEGTHERIVLLRILSMSEGEYKKYWTSQVVRGDADAEPITVPSFGMMKEAISVLPGSIGLVDAQNVKPGMKVIKVDGHLPGESGYPVH